VNLAKRIDCFYGQSSTGKSEALAALIEHIYEQEGLTSRVIVGDGSGATYRDRGLVDAGVVELLDFSIRPWPMTTMQQLTEGYWPANPDDPNSKLLPPNYDTLLKLGVFGVEGLSVASQYIMGDVKGGLAEQAGRGIKIGQDSPVRSVDILYDEKGNPIKDSGPGTSFGGNPVAHYGFAQRRLLSYVERTKMFPNWVVWTAHERSTQDKISGEKLVGPEASGEAITANLPRHFNNTLHFVTASKVGKKEKDDHTEKMVAELDVEYRIYTRDHFHPDGNSLVKYKAVTRGASEAEGMNLYYTNEMPGLAALEVYQKLAELSRARTEKLKAKTGKAA
jgi:hypothetical protein